MEVSCLNSRTYPSYRASTEGSLFHTWKQKDKDDHQREAEGTRVMEDIQFKNALLMNGILGEAIEFELARQFDVTLAPEVAESCTKTSLSQKVPENQNVDQKDEQGKLVKTVKGMSCLGLEISFVSVESFSAKDSGVSDLTVAATRRLSDLVIHDGQDFEVMSVEEENLMIAYITTMYRVPLLPKKLLSTENLIIIIYFRGLKMST